MQAGIYKTCDGCARTGERERMAIYKDILTRKRISADALKLAEMFLEIECANCHTCGNDFKNFATKKKFEKMA